MAQQQGGHKSRKVGRHNRGPNHHTPEQALRNKAMRVLQSEGMTAFKNYCGEHHLSALYARVAARHS